MLKVICSVLLIASMGLFFTGCTAGNEVRVELGEEFSLSIGQTAAISGEDLKLRFDEVSEDSRCPKYATCVWEGRVTCVVEVFDDQASQYINLTQPGLTDDYSIESYKNYELTFKVEPYPEVGKEISDGEYRLLLTVNR